MEQGTIAALSITIGIVIAVTLASLSLWFSPMREPVVIDAQADSSSAATIDYDLLSDGANLAELERGRVYFSQLCVDCHGVRGDGTGEWAFRVSPRATDLTSPWIQARSDDHLFQTISEGIVGTSMVGWKERLSPRQRWQLVGFVRHLGAGRRGNDGHAGTSRSTSLVSLAIKGRS